MRIYVHGGNPSDGPPLTCIVRLAPDVAPNATLADAAAVFASAYEAKRDVPLVLSELAFELSGGIRVDGQQQVALALKDRGDLFLVPKGDAAPTEAVACVSSSSHAPTHAPGTHASSGGTPSFPGLPHAQHAAAAAPAPAPAQQQLAPAPATAASRAAAAPSTAATAPAVAPPEAATAAVQLLLRQASEALSSQKHPRRAAQLLQHVLQIAPGHPDALRQLAALLLAAGRHQEALVHARRVADAQKQDWEVRVSSIVTALESTVYFFWLCQRLPLSRRGLQPNLYSKLGGSAVSILASQRILDGRRGQNLTAAT